MSTQTKTNRCAEETTHAVMCSYCLCGSQSLGIPGCGALNCLEEAWEEMVQKEEEGGRKGTVWCRDF